MGPKGLKVKQSLCGCMLTFILDQVIFPHLASLEAWVSTVHQDPSLSTVPQGRLWHLCHSHRGGDLTIKVKFDSQRIAIVLEPSSVAPGLYTIVQICLNKERALIYVQSGYPYYRPTHHAPLATVGVY